jgi:hypothetical protein
MALFELLQAAGLPEGVLNIVFADGPATFGGLEQALAAGTLDKIGFTGSTAVGARIGELAGRYLQSPCLELGGKNPMVVTPNADLSWPWRERCSPASAPPCFGSLPSIYFNHYHYTYTTITILLTFPLPTSSPTSPPPPLSHLSHCNILNYFSLAPFIAKH